MTYRTTRTHPFGRLVFALKLFALTVRLRVYARNDRRRSRAALWQWRLGEQHGRQQTLNEVRMFAHGQLQAHLVALEHCLGMAEVAPQSEQRDWIGKAQMQVCSLQRAVARLSSETGGPFRLPNLEQAVRECAANLSAAYPACSCHVEALGVSSECIASEAEQAMLLVLYNGLQNAYRHARPASILVQLHYAPDALMLIVADDGCGFTDGEIGFTGHGLRDMRRVIEQCAGTLAIESVPDSGTRITATVPYVAEHA